jgi:hypothetical protein
VPELLLRGRSWGAADPAGPMPVVSGYSWDGAEMCPPGLGSPRAKGRRVDAHTSEAGSPRHRGSRGGKYCPEPGLLYNRRGSREEHLAELSSQSHMGVVADGEHGEYVAGRRPRHNDAMERKGSGEDAFEGSYAEQPYRQSYPPDKHGDCERDACEGGYQRESMTKGRQSVRMQGSGRGHQVLHHEHTSARHSNRQSHAFGGRSAQHGAWVPHAAAAPAKQDAPLQDDSKFSRPSGLDAAHEDTSGHERWQEIPGHSQQQEDFNCAPQTAGTAAAVFSTLLNKDKMFGVF